ncbi:MAG: hypothetical protein H0S80_10655 [Desulfovibrionaceae bacterium]|nr:hypothetical protein [Desulfovibrionaceae bacterium]
MPDTSTSSIDLYDDILSKDFFHMSYLRRKAMAEDPQRLARVADAIEHIKSLLEDIDSETFEDLIRSISLLGSQASFSFIHQYEHDASIEYRSQLCSIIFTQEFIDTLDAIHEFSKDYVYDALSLTDEVPMDSYIEAIDDYWQLLDQNLHDVHELPEDLAEVNILSIYHRVTKLFPQKGYSVATDGNEVVMRASPCCPDFEFEKMLESVLKRIFYLRDQFEDISTDGISIIERTCREWLQRKTSAVWIDKKGLRGRLLGLWMWDYKYKREKITISATIDACYQYYHETFGQKLSVNSLREYFDGTRNCIKHGEIKPLSRPR